VAGDPITPGSVRQRVCGPLAGAYLAGSAG